MRIGVCFIGLYIYICVCVCVCFIFFIFHFFYVVFFYFWGFHWSHLAFNTLMKYYVFLFFSLMFWFSITPIVDQQP